MAKKQSKKGKTNAAKRSGASEPLAALYNLDAGTLRGDAVRAVLDGQGIRIKTVSADSLGNPVGAIVGIVGFRHLGKPFEGQAPETEFMLLHNVKGERLSALLTAMREADAVVDCKAQVTQYNRVWPFAMLVSEVSREHESMNAADAEAPIENDGEE
ncbi:MAG: DUF3783 domain-containing protein [Eggerthellaceae bacterium]|nr:DUF3783 domain-containing protein [Eggerthellaceae bacterium]